MAITNYWRRIGVATLVTAVFAVAVPIGIAVGPAGAAGASAVTTPVATTTKLVSSRPLANYGNAGAITATVKSLTTGAGVPTGTVDFSIDGGWYQSVPLDAVGKARLPLADIYPAFFPGPHQVTASYSGDATHDPSEAAAITQTLVGISTAPVSTISLNSRGLPVFTPRTFTLSSVNPVGCNVLLFNNTPSTVLLAYGTPGSWKRLPFGAVGPGQYGSVGVGIAPFTGYFTTTANLANYVTIHCR